MFLTRTSAENLTEPFPFDLGGDDLDGGAGGDGADGFECDWEKVDDGGGAKKSANMISTGVGYEMKLVRRRTLVFHLPFMLVRSIVPPLPALPSDPSLSSLSSSLPRSLPSSSLSSSLSSLPLSSLLSPPSSSGLK